MSPEHDKSAQFAAAANSMLREGNAFAARAFFSDAADFERIAWAKVDASKSRTKGVLAISVAALLFKARRFSEAEHFLHSVLSDRDIATPIRNDLRDLLEAVWDDASIQQGDSESSKSSFLLGLRGGRTGFGSAPLEAVQQSTAGFCRLYYRIGEWKSGIPFRTSGESSLKRSIPVRVRQAKAASYRFRLEFVEDKQKVLFPDDRVSSEEIGKLTMQILRDAVSGHADATGKIVSDTRYRKAILQLVRNILPDGTDTKEVIIAHGVADLEDSITLQTGHRECVNETLASLIDRQLQEAEIAGKLRAAHLNNQWLEIDTDSGPRQKCYFHQEIFDDLIGPMMNRHVVAKGAWKGSKFHLADIELSSA